MEMLLGIASLSTRHRSDDVRVSGVGDGQGADPVQEKT
jgi:hypothetical protein